MNIQNKAVAPSLTTLIAHRGESVDAPENTLPAYKMAVERGFGFECDIYLSTDKRVFSFHDGNLKRTTGLDLPCNQASWEEIVSKIDAGAWKGDQWKGVRPALLEEILELARNGRKIYIEVKTGPEILPYVKEIFARQNNATPANVLFISFNKETCKALRREMPEYKVYWLSIPRENWGADTSIVPVEKRIAEMRELGVHGVDMQFVPDIIDADYIAAVKKAGFEFHVWTVDTLENTLLAFSRGVDTVTTNCAKKQLDEYNAR